MSSISKLDDSLQFLAMSSLVPITHIDVALKALGALDSEPPISPGSSLTDRVSWGVESAVSAVRLLLCGQLVGAASVARSQMEVWLYDRARRLGLTQVGGESTLDFSARAWSEQDELYGKWREEHVAWLSSFDSDAGLVAGHDSEIEHDHVYRSDGSYICPPYTYAYLSEFLHLRIGSQALQYDLASPLDTTPEDVRSDFTAVFMMVCDAVALSLREVRLAALQLARGRGSHDIVKFLESGLDAISQREHESGLFKHDTWEDVRAIPFGAERAREVETPSLPMLMPLMPRHGLAPQAVAHVGAAANDFLSVLARERPAGRLYQDDELAVRAFAWHRYRSIRFAQAALAAERRSLGKEFDADSIVSRGSKWVLLAEAALLLSSWQSGPIAAATATMGSGLRSAFWLWLEDDDRAMAVLRVVLEAAAQSRTLRTKSAKAKKLRESSKTTPRDWLEAAGWKRLYALNQALGDMSHGRSIEGAAKARLKLAKMQVNAKPERAPFTARGAALDLVASLVARECAEWVKIVSPSLHPQFSELLKFFEYDLEEISDDLESTFDHIWNLRQTTSSTQPANSP